MASSLQTTIKRLVGRGAEDKAFYALELENARLLSGRSLSIMIPASFEDLLAMHEAIGEIIDRSTDQVSVRAKSPGTAEFRSVEKE